MSTKKQFLPDRLMPITERARFLETMVRASVKEATAQGASLTLVRPIESHFRWKVKPQIRVDAEKAAYESAARQTSIFDQELATIEPVPFEFRLRFRDADGWHNHSCADWETTAAYWKLSRKYGTDGALSHLDRTYNIEYPGSGFVLALGNMAKRPQTWQLLGIIRLDEPAENELPL
jgi:hypothetical protein